MLFNRTDKLRDDIDANAVVTDSIEGVTAGTQAAGKAVIANADVNIGVVKATQLHIGATGSETQVTATAAELNILDTVTATAAELNVLDIVTPGTGAASKAVVLDSGDDYTWPAAGVFTYGVLADASTTLGATAAELNSAADVSTKYVNTGDVDTHVVLVADSGKLHIIPLVTGDIAITLPAPAAGLEYRFASGAPTAEGDDWIFTATNDFIGGLAQVDTDGSSAAVLASGSSTNTCTVVAPLAGTHIQMVSDGTDWFISGFVLAVAVPTFTDV